MFKFKLIRVSLIFLYFVLGFFLTTIPFGEDHLIYKPNFVLALLIFWSWWAPNNVGYIISLIIGIFYDSLVAVPLGENAIGFIIVVFLNARIAHLVKNSSRITHFLLIFLIVTFYELVLVVLNIFVYQIPSFGFEFFIPIFSTSLLWLVFWYTIPQFNSLIYRLFGYKVFERVGL